MIYKYVVKNTARQHSMTATFMPKPLFEDNASGMHVHQSLWKGETNLFYDKGDYAELSQLGRYYIGGLLTHAWALCGLCAPTTNSYRRLVPGYEAPISIPSATAQLAAGFRCIRRTRGQSGLSFARRIPPAIPIWPLPRC